VPDVSLATVESEYSYVALAAVMPPFSNFQSASALTALPKILENMIGHKQGATLVA
jgi:hypothetical protein